MQKRINVSLPKNTVRLLDRAAEPGERSALIDKAVRHYLAGRKNLRKRLREGYEANAARDREIAQEWEVVDATL